MLASALSSLANPNVLYFKKYISLENGHAVMEDE